MSRSRLLPSLLGTAIAVALLGVVVGFWMTRKSPAPVEELQPKLVYEPRRPFDVGGFMSVMPVIPSWGERASLQDVANSWRTAAQYADRLIATHLAEEGLGASTRVGLLLTRASILGYEGKASEAYHALCELRTFVEADPLLAQEWLYTVIFCQGAAALRRGEDENCIMCRGESSCIVPIAPAAVHLNRVGSTTAVKHFTEYLDQFPTALDARWLLNLAHMTLGEYPDKVDPRYLLPLDRYLKPEFDIGRFRDVGHIVGVNRLNQAGGAILDDFDNDGLLDVMVSSWDSSMPLAFYRNLGDGTFEDRARQAGLLEQLGGLNCCQADFDNDGHLDFLILRGAWWEHPVRPSLMRNNGNGTFSDVTREAGMQTPLNTIAAVWGDYDNDGLLDVFICCERQPCRLFHNLGKGKFEEVAAAAGVAGQPGSISKGAAWIDYDNDGYPDLLVSNMRGPTCFYRNNRDGTFTLMTSSVGIDGPQVGFACWAWDYDNDGFLDLFVNSYDRSLEDIVAGLVGRPHKRNTGKLYRNLAGKGFQDVTREAGLDLVFATMGCNYGDFDNDGYLDFYLGTGDPELTTLVPNRMFKNVGGKRFSEITSSTGVGHLQKGHGVGCGDWDRNGTLDLFIQMGGAIPGDSYHNVLFQNPGQGNNWLNVKCVGVKTNRSAIGARIKVVTSSNPPQTIHRHVSSGSSFGANPLEQHIGIGKADTIATLEIFWPTSGTTQVFRDLPANQAIEITEFATEYKPRAYKPIPLPGR